MERRTLALNLAMGRHIGPRNHVYLVPGGRQAAGFTRHPGIDLPVIIDEHHYPFHEFQARRARRASPAICSS